MEQGTDVSRETFGKGFRRSLFKYSGNSVHSNFNSNDPIRSQFCTCHNSWAVMTCANLWPDMLCISKVRATHFFQDLNYELINPLGHGSQVTYEDTLTSQQPRVATITSISYTSSPSYNHCHYKRAIKNLNTKYQVWLTKMPGLSWVLYTTASWEIQRTLPAVIDQACVQVRTAWGCLSHRPWSSLTWFASFP